MADSPQTSGGVGVVGLLGVVFVTLKLLGVIDWSWWWVTAPFWGGALVWLIVMAILVTAFVWIELTKQKPRRRD